MSTGSRSPRYPFVLVLLLLPQQCCRKCAKVFVTKTMRHSLSAILTFLLGLLLLDPARNWRSVAEIWPALSHKSLPAAWLGLP